MNLDIPTLERVLAAAERRDESINVRLRNARPGTDYHAGLVGDWDRNLKDLEVLRRALKSAKFEQASPTRSPAPAPPAPSSGPTLADVQAVMKGMAPAICNVIEDAIAEATEPLHKQIDALTAAVAALEASQATKRTMAWAGVWRRTDDYKRGEAVTHSGGLWLALKDIESGVRPGDGETNWVLVIKGRPGE